MRLVEYLKEAAVVVTGAKTLMDVQCFSFGDIYKVVMKNGWACSFADLEDILSVMGSEFAVCPALRMRIAIQNRTLGSIRATSRELVVHPVEYHFLKGMEGEPFFGGGATFRNKPIAEQIDTIRQAVTLFNLTQSWDQFNKGNL